MNEGDVIRLLFRTMSLATLWCVVIVSAFVPTRLSVCLIAFLQRPSSFLSHFCFHGRLGSAEVNRPRTVQLYRIMARGVSCEMRDGRECHALFDTDAISAFDVG